MRKANAIISLALIILLCIHGILGAMSLYGIGYVTLRPLAWVMLGLLASHIVLSCILTARTIAALRRTGTCYWKQNRLFWIRRLSGLAILVLLFLHLTVFSTARTGGLLHWFHVADLLSQLLFVAAIAVHVLSNLRPLLIALGRNRVRERAANILLALCIFLLFMAGGMLVYFLRWNVF